MPALLPILSRKGPRAFEVDLTQLQQKQSTILLERFHMLRAAILGLYTIEPVEECNSNSQGRRVTFYKYEEYDLNPTEPVVVLEENKEGGGEWKVDPERTDEIFNLSLGSHKHSEGGILYCRELRPPQECHGKQPALTNCSHHQWACRSCFGLVWSAIIRQCGRQATLNGTTFLVR